MKNFFIAALSFLFLVSNVSAETIWYAERFPSGLSTLKGVFDSEGTGVIFGCTDSYFTAGAIVLVNDVKKQTPTGTKIQVTTSDSESVTFVADPVQSDVSNYTFISRDLVSSITAFHLFDKSQGIPVKIIMKNNSINLSGQWLAETTSAKEAIADFKKICPLIDK